MSRKIKRNKKNKRSKMQARPLNRFEVIKFIDALETILTCNEKVFNDYLRSVDKILEDQFILGATGQNNLLKYIGEYEKISREFVLKISKLEDKVIDEILLSASLCSKNAYSFSRDSV